MVRNADGALSPAAHAMEAKIRQTCTMHDEAYSLEKFGHLVGSSEQMEPLVLPNVPGDKRLRYTTYINVSHCSF